MPVRKDGDGREGLLAKRLQPFRVGEQSAAVLRQANMAAAAIKQRKTELLFKSLDLFGVPTEFGPQSTLSKVQH
jgi:hypothetical protein